MSLKGIALAVMLSFVQEARSGDFGSLKCTNGAWVPDAKILGFAVSCPLPLDGKSKSKGKTAVCALKKVGVYDGKTVKKDQIAPEICGVFPQDGINKQCKKTVKECVKKTKDAFKDPKKDTSYKSWSEPYECIEKWTQNVCKK